MARLLVAASVLWPALLGAAAWQEAHGHRSVWASSVYLAASRVCHQRADRSFVSGGVQWPVCGRCSGLYGGGALGGLLAVTGAARRLGRRSLRWAIGAALAPAAASALLEWTEMAAVGNVARAATALPLGVAVAFAIVLAADRTWPTMRQDPAR